MRRRKESFRLKQLLISGSAIIHIIWEVGCWNDLPKSNIVPERVRVRPVARNNISCIQAEKETGNFVALCARRQDWGTYRYAGKKKQRLV